MRSKKKKSGGIYYSDELVTIYHGDCRDILPTLPKVDLVLTDPPYGIGANKQTLGTGKKEFYRGGNWDAERTPLVNMLPDIAGEVVVWGGNYYTDMLEPTNDWLIWHKKNDGLSFSECEVAWSNLGCQMRHISHHWGGECKVHPTEKPLAVIVWAMSYSKTEGLVFDPFMGSGTTLRAAKNLGRKAIGIEIEEKYCEIAAKRMLEPTPLERTVEEGSIADQVRKSLGYNNPTFLKGGV